jgi:hypothetical protein
MTLETKVKMHFAELDKWIKNLPVNERKFDDSKEIEHIPKLY